MENLKYIIEPSYPDAPIRYFQELTQIPRASGKEEKVSEWLLDFASAHGFEAKRDDLYNVVIYKEGQGAGVGMEPVIMQGHQDMVCEKNDETTFDFDTEPLNIYMDGDLMKAKGTTLGGDDGVAVAYMLSVLASKELNHPPLECLFTTQEETGMGGAEAVNPAWFKGRRMVNLDCGPENVFVVSSAGGARMELVISEEKGALSAGDCVTLRVEGLLGGHSGECIGLERGNALKILGRLLYAISKEEEVQILSIEGGDKDNAIPRECTAKIVVHNGNQVVNDLQTLISEILEEYKPVEPSISIIASVEMIAKEEKVFSKSMSKNMVEMLFLLPNGPSRRYVEQDMVASSNNVASIHTTENAIKLITSVRAAEDSMMDEVIERIRLTGERSGATVELYSRYPGWAYDPDSKLRQKAEEVYELIFGMKPEIEMVHAGLECGLFKGKIPDLDIIATGPKTISIHTPEEALDIPSFEREFIFVKALLESFCE